jgi:hypothetical protein
MEAIRMQHLLEPLHALEEEDIVAERLLHRIVHHRHQRDDGIERDQHDHGKDVEPAPLIFGLGGHRHSTSQPSA